MSALKSKSEQSQGSIIALPTFEEILAQFGVRLGDRERKLFYDAYSTKKDQDPKQVMVSIDKCTQLEKTQQLKKIYDAVDLEAMEDEQEEENYKDFDAQIAFGQKHLHQHLEPLLEDQLLTLLSRESGKL